ncbi:MAG: TldD/PmbA family protein [Bacilli bacterium]|nr:TldD/PmbA family protein [Bacilli bacterium]
MFSKQLLSRKKYCQLLLEKLLEKYPYASILGKQIKGKTIICIKDSNRIGDTREKEYGFVARVFNGKNYVEYSFVEINENNIPDLINKIDKEANLASNIEAKLMPETVLKDEPLVQNFVRNKEGRDFTDQEIQNFLEEYRQELLNYDPRIVFAQLLHECFEVSSFFMSRNRNLTQNYSWSNIMVYIASKDENNMQSVYQTYAYNNLETCMQKAKEQLKDNAQLAIDLLSSTNIKPGVYDIITAPSITGLIAHEAFGHGVEMDMFVKHRAEARKYINKRVASKLVNMHDGAASTLSQASYFFDDEGVLAHDTLIIKEGILLTGICDSVSANELKSNATGNGRRESTQRKAYTRMTNTFFEPGDDNLEDMIKSIKHGYMLFQTNNGMEDPKNWNIQCTACYGREIKDGVFTGKIVAPVVMSGFVLDLLNSISMVSKDFEVIGAGHCGKGYKEWVPVSDGGPYLKARCKLG